MRKICSKILNDMESFSSFCLFHLCTHKYWFKIRLHWTNKNENTYKIRPTHWFATCWHWMQLHSFQLKYRFIRLGLVKCSLSFRKINSTPTIPIEIILNGTNSNKLFLSCHTSQIESYTNQLMRVIFGHKSSAQVQYWIISIDKIFNNESEWVN